jgi:hypothetical protein
MYVTRRYAHQSRFAGAIFTKQRMNFSRSGRERDIPDGLDRSETLGNAGQLQHSRSCLQRIVGQG